MENILLAQEVVRDYHLKTGKPICTLKVNIMKAFDTVSWDFILKLFTVLLFPPDFIQWISTCLTIPKFSLNINGKLVGFFRGQRGLRQGDPPLTLPFCALYECFF